MTDPYAVEATIEITIKYDKEEAIPSVHRLAEVADALMEDEKNCPFRQDQSVITGWRAVATVKSGVGLGVETSDKRWKITRKEMEKAVLKAIESWPHERLVDFVRGDLESSMRLDSLQTIRELYSIEVLERDPESTNPREG